MPRYGELAPAPREHGYEDELHLTTARGRVIRAPASTADAMAVVLENYSTDFDVEIPGSRWTPRTVEVTYEGQALCRIVLPLVDDVCVVVFDDAMDAWIPVYGEDA